MNGLQYSDADKKRRDEIVAQEVDAASKPLREILRSIHEAVFNLNSSDPVKIARVQARHATLLVSVSEYQAKSAAKLEEQTARLIEETLKLTGLTRSLNRLTFILGVLAVLQVFIMFYEYFSKPH